MNRQYSNIPSRFLRCALLISFLVGVTFGSGLHLHRWIEHVHDDAPSHSHEWIAHHHGLTIGDSSDTNLLKEDEHAHAIPLLQLTALHDRHGARSRIQKIGHDYVSAAAQSDSIDRALTVIEIIPHAASPPLPSQIGFPLSGRSPPNA